MLGHPLTASAAHLYWKYIPSKALFMSKSKPQKDEFLPTSADRATPFRTTSVILQAVDERFVAQEIRIRRQTLKHVSDIEEEFTFMKEDIKRVKAVLREKLAQQLSATSYGALAGFACHPR